MYSKKKDRELFKEIDDSLSIPKKFNNFTSKISKKHNLIIKYKNKYVCTNCKTVHNSKIHKNIGEYHICSECNQKLLIKTNKLKKYTFKDNICIFDKYKDYYIERIFELRSDYNGKDFEHTYFEWGRKIYNKETFDLKNEIMNENVIGTPSGFWISYRPFSKRKWFESDSYWKPIRYIDEFIYYPGTLKKILCKDERFKYSQLWETVKHVGYVDLIYLLSNYNSSIELLTKMKLYNLALNPKTFYKKCNFQERFLGLDKSYLPFMKKYNITLQELEVLSTIKIKDIKLIRRITEIPNYKELIEDIDIIKALELTDLNDNNCTEYADYLSIAKIINLNQKKDLYPKNITLAHDQILKRYKVSKDKVIDRRISVIEKNLKKYIYQDKNFIIFPASSIKSLEDEASQQHNCVSTYAERIAKGECNVYFMRAIKDFNKSLVTVEVKDSEIVQKRTKYNKTTNKQQDKFLDKWEKEVLNSC